MTGEEAAAEVLRKRRVFARLRKRIAEGDRSRRLVREVGQQSRELAGVLARFDGPPRATWTSLLTRFETLHADLDVARSGHRDSRVHSLGN
jgi:hypothetical protein